MVGDFFLPYFNISKRPYTHENRSLFSTHNFHERVVVKDSMLFMVEKYGYPLAFLKTFFLTHSIL